MVREWIEAIIITVGFALALGFALLLVGLTAPLHAQDGPRPGAVEMEGVGSGETSRAVPDAFGI